jgi:hypothetical protein
MKKLLILLLIFGCATPKTLHQTGTYTVASVDKYVVTFRGIAGRYQLPVDTLKVCDTVRMNVIKLKR